MSTVQTNGQIPLQQDFRTSSPRKLTLQEQIRQLEAENATLQERLHRAPKPSLKVSDKGGVSVYGLGRFPFTLYKEQWRKLLDMADEIRDFIDLHEAELAMKPRK